MDRHVSKVSVYFTPGAHLCPLLRRKSTIVLLVAIVVMLAAHPWRAILETKIARRAVEYDQVGGPLLLLIERRVPDFRLADSSYAATIEPSLPSSYEYAGGSLSILGDEVPLWQEGQRQTDWMVCSRRSVLGAYQYDFLNPALRWVGEISGRDVLDPASEPRVTTRRRIFLSARDEDKDGRCEVMLVWINYFEPDAPRVRRHVFLSVGPRENEILWVADTLWGSRLGVHVAATHPDTISIRLERDPSVSWRIPFAADSGRYELGKTDRAPLLSEGVRVWEPPAARRVFCPSEKLLNECLDALIPSVESMRDLADELEPDPAAVPK